MTLYHEGAAVGKPYPPLAGVTACVRKVDTVHHIVLMAVDILVAQAADVIHLLHGLRPVLLFDVPSVLVYEVLYHGVRYVRIYGFGSLVAHGIGHAVFHGATDCAVVGVGAGSALLLGIPATVFGVEEVGDAEVHHRVYLLHAALGAVIVEVGPGHACQCVFAGNGRSELAVDLGGADNGAQMFVIVVPVGFHVLYLCRVGKDDLVKLRCNEYGEVERHCSFGHIDNEVHARLELVGDGRDYDLADLVALRVAEDGTHEVGAGNGREAHPAVFRYVDGADGIGIVVAVGGGKCSLAGHDLAALYVSASSFYVIESDNIGFGPGRGFVLCVATVA